MKRRHFIKRTAAAGIFLPFIITSCESKRSSLANPESQSKSADSFELDELTVEGLQEKMTDGVYTSQRITRLYLDQIERIDRKGPKLNSVIEINPDAMAIAEQMDRERKEGKIRGPLHGIPVLIKDNIDTADKMMTTAGSLAMEGNYAKQDSYVVKKLRDAGAVILGKTNLSEWANFRSTRSSSGWSSRGGQTKNPFVLDRNPCGSSSGSGTAVSANLCAVAIGTETNGSIACPSSINGIVGIKPTVGLVSRAGIIPISHTQDTAGPMTRTVADAALVLSAIAGQDERDPATRKIKSGDFNYNAYLKADSLQGKRIGVEKSFLKVHEGVDSLLQKALEQMKNAGATIVEVDFLSRIKIKGAEYDVLQFEFKDGLNKYLTSAEGKVKSLKDLIAFNKQNESTVMPYFKQEILEGSEEKAGLDSQEYQEALKKVTSVASIIDNVLKEEKLDAICGPTNGPSWCTDLVNGNHFTGYGAYSPAAMAGYPSITVPMGIVHDLPVGLTFFAEAFSEGKLISIAYAYEQISKNRKKPQFKASA